MKQYRIKYSVKQDADWIWSIWMSIAVSIPVEYRAMGILTIQFNAPLTVKEAKEFFKNYEVV